jgi:hypothetical protein
VKICAYETPFYRMLKLRFADGQLTYNSEVNVGFGGTKQPTLVGKAE